MDKVFYGIAILAVLVLGFLFLNMEMFENPDVFENKEDLLNEANIKYNEVVISKLKEYMLDKNWIENNIRINLTEAEEKSLPEKMFKYTYTFNVIHDNITYAPIAIINLDMENKFRTVYAVYYDEVTNNINCEKLFNNNLNAKCEYITVTDTTFIYNSSKENNYKYEEYNFSNYSKNLIESKDGIDNDANSFLESFNNSKNSKAIDLEINETNINEYVK